jgi:hypothetical protein
MPDSMPDISARWRPEPDWPNARLQGPTLDIRAVPSLPQRLVSGDIARFLDRHGLGEGLGALGLASGGRYAVRVARDRLLVVGLAAAECVDGWHAEGYGVSTVGSGLRVLDAQGAGVRDLLARATTVDPDDPGPSAALLFCGLTCTVYFHGDRQTLRVHVDRSLAAYLWEWLEGQPLLAGEAGGGRG